MASDWPLQDILSLRGFCARINPPCIAPPSLALLTPLQYDCTDIAQNTTLPPTPLLYDIHYTILAIAISCKGQASDEVESPSTGIVLLRRLFYEL